MAVYVDDWRMPARVGRLSARWSHLMADSREELDAFARRLDLRSDWLQDKHSGLHYDVTDSVRARAFRLGAVSLHCGSPEWRRVVGQARAQASPIGGVSATMPIQPALFDLTREMPATAVPSDPRGRPD